MMQTPDEILIMPTEEYLKWITASFANSPFVAFNTARTFVAAPGGEGEAPSFVGNVAVGFDMDQAHHIPEAMAVLTGNDHQVLTAVDPDIAEMLKARFQPGVMLDGGLYVGEITEEEITDDGDKKVTITPANHPELEAALASLTAAEVTAVLDETHGVVEF